MSQIFAPHLNALHSAREEFIKSEADERIRRALRHKISNIEQNFNNGEYVYYKRDGKPMWLGPAKVIAQDGKVVFIRHGGILIRLTPNRLMKATSLKDTQNQSKTIISKEVESQKFLESNPNDESNEDTNQDMVNNGIDSDEVVNEEFPNQDFISHDQTKINSNSKNENEETVFVPRRSLRVLNKEMNWDVHDAFVVQVPKSQQGHEDCMKAKIEELNKLKEFNVYSEEEFYGQKCISTRWVIV